MYQQIPVFAQPLMAPQHHHQQQQHLQQLHHHQQQQQQVGFPVITNIPSTVDWRCPCGYVNFASRPKCNMCSRPRDSNAMAAVGRQTGSKPFARLMPGDWICSCNVHNFRSRNTCISCGTRKTVEQPSSTVSSEWQNPSVTVIPEPVKSGDWTCPTCKFHNFASRDICKSCPTAKPPNTPAAQKVVPAISMKPGDWLCMTCGCQNFARRSNCYNCNTLKPPQPPQLLQGLQQTN